MNLILERLKQVSDYYNVKVTQMEAAIGASKGVLSRAIANGTDIQSKWLVSIVENYQQINPGWLLTGKGEMLVSDIDVDLNKGPARKVYKLKTDRLYQTQDVPLYPIEATAGMVTLFNDSKNLQPVDYIHIPNLPKCDGAVYVTGNSMYPLLKSGDIIMYKIMQDMKRGVIWGEMYMISIDYDGDDIVSVKWLQKSEKGDDWIQLVSENRHHHPIDIEWSRIRALALVKASIRINSMS